MTAAEGDKVKIDYIGTLEDGTLFETTQDKESAEFTIGKGQVIRGLEQAVVGMKPGEKKTVTINPQDAYGPVRPELFAHHIPRAELHANIKPVKDMMLQWNLPNGKQLIVKVIDVTDDTVSFDGNHLLAGKTLVFDITMLELYKN